MPEPTHPRPLPPEELGFESIVYEKAPPRATIRLNRPDVLNAFDFRMLREIARACEDASWDDDVRVVVVTGEGRAFCVGADLRSWEDTLVGRPQEYWKWFGAFKDMHDRIRELGKPTIARINGIAVGGGNELQMACDLAQHGRGGQGVDLLAGRLALLAHVRDPERRGGAESAPRGSRRDEDQYEDRHQVRQRLEELGGDRDAARLQDQR